MRNEMNFQHLMQLPIKYQFNQDSCTHLVFKSNSNQQHHHPICVPMQGSSRQVLIRCIVIQPPICRILVPQQHIQVCTYDNQLDREIVQGNLHDNMGIRINWKKCCRFYYSYLLRVRPFTSKKYVSRLVSLYQSQYVLTAYNNLQ